MISPEKLAANQANAQHSTGPQTPPQQNRDRQGADSEAASAQNARTHGLCASDRLVANEDQAEFIAMEVKLILDIGPKGELEQILFNEILTASWQLRRICRMETELSAGHDSYTALLDDEGLQKKLDRLGRHHTRFERTFHRSLKELKALQTSRAQKEEAPEENQDRPDLATPAKPASKISKRTQPASEPEPDQPITAEEYAEMDKFYAQLTEKYGLRIDNIGDKAA
jgi:hypothetical protein